MSGPFVVGCRDCGFQRTVAGLDAALDVYEDHKEPGARPHRSEVWSRTYLADLGEDAPGYMPSIETTDNAPSPDPLVGGETGSKRADTDD
jgi:hypothetical protein